MPTKKKTVAKKRKITIEAAVQVIPPKEKRVPASAFKPGNEQAKKWFKGMASPNPSGGPKRDGLKLVSRALRVQLNLQAPHAECRAVNLKPGSSWAQVVAAAILLQSVRGDMGAARLLLDFTEKVNNTRIEVPVDDDGNPIPLVAPSLNIVFTDTSAGEALLQQDLLGDGSLSPGD